MAECESLIPSICGGKLVPWLGDEEVIIPIPSILITFGAGIDIGDENEEAEPPYTPSAGDTFSFDAILENNGDVDFDKVILKSSLYPQDVQTNNLIVGGRYYRGYSTTLLQEWLNTDGISFTFSAECYKPNATEPILTKSYEGYLDYETLQLTMTEI